MVEPHLPGLFDERLEELAVSVHGSTVPRLLAALAVSPIILAFAALPVALAWTLAVFAIEGWSWLATRSAYRQRPFTKTDRVNHLTSFVAGTAAWTFLGCLFWKSGTAAGAVCAAAIWLSIMGLAQIHAYRSRLGHLITGVAPGVAMLVTVLLVPNPAIPGFAPVWPMLLIAVAFAGFRTREVMTVRKTYEKVIADLRESEASYRMLADNITDVISVTGAKGERLYVSPSIERALGISAEELLVTPNYKYLHADDADAVRALIESVTRDGGERSAEYRVHRKDGGFIWADTTFTRLNDGSDRVLAVSREVTQRKQLESELVDALARSEAASAAKADFLANMTHELRTPLNAILGFSGVLARSAALTDRDARHVGLIHDASATLLGVIGDVLDFSKLDAGAFELDPQPFDPADLAQSVAAMVADGAREKGLLLNVDVGAVRGGLVGDAPRLRQVLLNFLSNAIKFTSLGAVDLVASQQAEGEMVRLRLEVRDCGIGIPADQTEAVFMRFTQADASVSRLFGGTGLGLAISKRIIEKMGGQIGVTSVLGQGSTFWFEVTLPVAADLRARPDPQQDREDFDRCLRVLLVEDNAVNRELVGALLSGFDVELETAINGAEALEAFDRARYDIILMDIQMPVMDGLTATRRIRALGTPEAMRVPIIAMTANVLPDQVLRCHEAGMSGHLGKPIDPASLLETLARWAQDETAASAALTG
jgi:PAS domain S-box-containing protein